MPPLPAGFPGIHLNGVLWGLQLLPGEQTISDPAALVKLFGLDSVTSYVWVHHARLERFPVTPYAEVFAANRAYWDSAASTYAAPYFPNVTMGWDASPRTLQDTEYTDRGYPYMATMSTTPEEFGAAIRAAKDNTTDTDDTVNDADSGDTPAADQTSADTNGDQQH